MADLNEQKLTTAVQALTTNDQNVVPATCNVSVEADVQAAVKTAIDHFGHLDIVVNNAGLMSFKPIEEQTEEDWTRIIKVDLLGAFFFIKHSFLNMKPGGAIINVARIHAIETEPLVAPYAAAKAALVSLTRSAALEGKPKGIRVNAILPGAIDTPMLWDNPNVKAGVEKINPADVGKPRRHCLHHHLSCLRRSCLCAGRHAYCRWRKTGPFVGTAGKINVVPATKVLFIACCGVCVGLSALRMSCIIVL